MFNSHFMLLSSTVKTPIKDIQKFKVMLLKCILARQNELQNLTQNLSHICCYLQRCLSLAVFSFRVVSLTRRQTRHDASTRAELEFRNEKSKQTSRDCRNDESDAEVKYPVDTRSYNGTHVANGLCNRELS